MGELLLYVLISLVLLLLSLHFLFEKPKPRSDSSRIPTITEFLPIHHREFEQVAHRLSEYDALLQKIHSERREVALGYLDALRGDFLRVDRLLNHAAKFLPGITLRGEAERLWVGMRFQLEYRIARMRASLGFVPAVQMGVLARQVRLLAQRADEALEMVARAYGLSMLQSDLNK